MNRNVHNAAVSFFVDDIRILCPLEFGITVVID